MERDTAWRVTKGKNEGKRMGGKGPQSTHSKNSDFGTPPVSLGPVELEEPAGAEAPLCRGNFD